MHLVRDTDFFGKNSPLLAAEASVSCNREAKMVPAKSSFLLLGIERLDTESPNPKGSSPMFKFCLGNLGLSLGFLD